MYLLKASGGLGLGVGSTTVLPIPVREPSDAFDKKCLSEIYDFILQLFFFWILLAIIMCWPTLYHWSAESIHFHAHGIHGFQFNPLHPVNTVTL